MSFKNEAARIAYAGTKVLGGIMTKHAKLNVSLGILGESEWEIEYEYTPGVEATFYDPAEPPEFEITSIYENGKDITNAVADLTDWEALNTDIYCMLEDAGEF